MEGEEAGRPNISDFFPLVRVFDLQGERRRMEGYFQRLHKIFGELIDQRLQAMKLDSASNNNDFLDSIINCHACYEIIARGNKINYFTCF